MTASLSIDLEKLTELVGRLKIDAAAVATTPLVIIGDRLGLFRTLAANPPMTSQALADATNTFERHVREWLAAMSAAAYVVYDPATERYTMTPEQAMALAHTESPAFFIGAFETASSTIIDRQKIEEAFVSGEGVGWHEHDEMLFCGCERFFRSGYIANLVANWLPALDGVVAKLEVGARVADIGCGHGASTILMAQAFPNSKFYGFDYHRESIEAAVKAAQAAGVADRVVFDIASADQYPGSNYDLVTVFDALHDMGDPIGASAHVAKTLKPDGTWMIVEPMAGDRLEDNLNLVGRLYYSASTMLCTPASLSQEGRMGLGAQAGQKRLTEVLNAGGFSRVRRATETPFNMVLEARL